ncbi:uncharacterized protein F5Z01DRAFT_670865 [Emericellopsis atlantica]|uniref:Uncharacterized protein n=1 Tax=Emericellopsis atlantica TaxID=2614577 RepID=A0A9P7ZV10_9HYPO|nr:uncharacterized protein F5Z01DRAFT_670865 [Emericellopsis atlantica]KAG9258215.1 hypothetical protein F5Z01DRAFT_670865 [Emericellopsis atlantica]
MAVTGQKERKLASQGSMSSSAASSSSGGSNVHDSLPLPVPVPVPRLSPPPTASGRPSGSREMARPVESLPRLQIPPPPPIPEDPSPSPPQPPPKSPLSPLLARARSKRRTIMSRVEGWWDLGLLDRRQTLFGKKG